MFETAVVNEPSVFEPLKFYYISILSKYFTNKLLLVYQIQPPGETDQKSEKCQSRTMEIIQIVCQSYISWSSHIAQTINTLPLRLLKCLKQL